MKKGCGGDGRGVTRGTMERFLLSEEFRLELDERGVNLNHSGEGGKTTLGLANRLVSGGGGGFDTKNWLETFTKSGCVVCKDVTGWSNHKGIDGKPVVLVVGDEAVPSVLGYTGQEVWTPPAGGFSQRSIWP
jgi:hypothetical protein